jgi:hypothetical protein
MDDVDQGKAEADESNTEVLMNIDNELPVVTKTNDALGGEGPLKEKQIVELLIGSL